jgi:hypothetical protein
LNTADAIVDDLLAEARLDHCRAVAALDMADAFYEGPDAIPNAPTISASIRRDHWNERGRPGWNAWNARLKELIADNRRRLEVIELVIAAQRTGGSK